MKLQTLNECEIYFLVYVMNLIQNEINNLIDLINNIDS